jgi:ABC-type nitrate/sulfonate/bicarbonate transport system substrate-binding protein
MKTRSVWCLCLLLAGVASLYLPLRGEEPFSKLVGDVKVGEVKKADVYEVPFILWGGDVATFVANGGLETKPDSIYGKAGLKLKLTPGDDFIGQVKNYLSGKSPFLRGTFSMLGEASEVIGADPKTKPVVFLQLTWSAGDHMVVRESIKTAVDLKGKKVALQKIGPHEGMLGDILHTADLSWKDITVVYTDDVTGEKGPAELFKKDPSIDACFVVTPDMQALTGGADKTGTGAEGTVKGARVLVSTRTMSRSIADVYACRKDFYDANKDLVEKFAAGYLKACEEIVDLQKKGAKDKDAAAKYKAILKMTQDIYGKAIPGEAEAADLIADAVFVGLPGNRSFFTDKGNLTGFDAKQKAALDLAINLGYAKERKEFAKPDYANKDEGKGYVDLKASGDLKTDAFEKTGSVEAKVVLPTDQKKIEDDTISFFTINFKPDQSTFDENQYGKDFERALEQAALFGHAVVAVRGHSDNLALLQKFVEEGTKQGLLKKVSAGKYTLKDGTELDLNDAKKVIETIQKLNFGGVAAQDDPKAMLKGLQELSEKRANTVRDTVIKFAKAKKINLDENQLKVAGVGVLEPAVATPRSEDDMAKNRRVEFRIIKVPLEAISAKDFNY